jgi:hypothetical protein
VTPARRDSPAPRRHRLLLLTALAVLAVLPREAPAEPSFAPPTVISTVGATFVAVGDVNKDGRPDIVALDIQTGGAASVLLNDGTGRFPTRIDLTLPIVTRWIGIGEFTGNTNPDLLLVGAGGNVRILSGSGNGNFVDAGGPIIPGVSNFVDAAIADVDGDGRLDLVAAYVDLTSVVVRLLGQAGGGLGAPTTVHTIQGSIAGTIGAVALADVDGSGRPDLLVGVIPPISTGSVRVLLNDGSGNFGAFTGFATGAASSARLAVGDMDGDGGLDVVTVSQDFSLFKGKLTVLRNNGTTTQWNGLAANVEVGGFIPLAPWALALADIDGDGRTDVVTAAIDSGSGDDTRVLRVHTRTDAAFVSSFADAVEIPLGLQLTSPVPGNVVAVDLNGDGKPDVVAAVDVNHSATPVPANFPDSVLVFLNTAPTAPVGGNVRLTVARGGRGLGLVTSSPAGINCGATTACSVLLPAGPPAPTVTLTAAAATGSTFTGWSGGGCAGTAPCLVTLDANETVVAFFALNGELGAPEITDEWQPLGVTLSFVNVGTPAFNMDVLSTGNVYTETSVVKLNGVNQATTPLFSGSGAALQAFVPYASLPSVAAAPQTADITVLNGLPSGPFSLSTPFPLHALRACRTQPDPCVTAVTAVPSPANPNAVAFVLDARAASNLVFFDFADVRINGQDRATTYASCDQLNSTCSTAFVSVLFADILSAGTLMVANTNASHPGVGRFTIRPPVQIAVGSPLPGGTVNGGYSRTITATGGSATKSWAVTAGALPPGLTLGAGTGVLSGTPTQAGTFEFTVTVTDEDFPAAKAVQAYALTIAPALLITTGSPLAASTQGVAYAQVTLQATGGTGSRTWSVSAGALPAGMTLSGAGVVSGTPTASGTFNFTAKVTDAAGAFVTKAFALTINAPLSVTTSSLPGGTKGAVYPTQTLAATGGTGGRTWTISAGALPGGLTLSAGGSISGTPTGVGTFAFTVRVTDGVGATATKGLSIAIAADTAGPAVTIQSPAPPKGSATSTPLLVSGVASDNVGVTQVSWANDRGGSGGASGTTAWVASGIPLQPGKNVITITARDAANNAGTAQVAIYFFQDTLSAGATPIKAVHFLQLATAIENLRTRLGVPGSPAFAWTGATPGVGGPVRASQLNDLRGALGTLYDHAGVAVGTTFTRTPIAAGARIDAAHVAELRAGIRALP